MNISDKRLLEEQENFLEFIKNYEYINKNGRLDLEPFCVHLSLCFFYDGLKEKAPQPRDIYNLLIQHLQDFAKGDEMALWVQTQRLIDWTPEIESIYPDKYRTYIHIAGLIHVMHKWIYDIGHILITIPEPTESRKYFDWVDEKWVFVFTFVDGFHNYYTEFLKSFDQKLAKEKGYSTFEALHTSMRTDCDFNQAVNQLKKRHSVQNEALLKIQEAMDSDFYLEAITLQECLISNYIFNYLQSKGKSLKRPSFSKILFECGKIKSASPESKSLFKKVDKWRVKRNKAIHGFISSKIDSHSQSQNNFLKFSKTTAGKGLELCQAVCDWYGYESVNFIPTKFPKENDVLSN